MQGFKSIHLYVVLKSLLLLVSLREIPKQLIVLYQRLVQGTMFLNNIFSFFLALKDYIILYKEWSYIEMITKQDMFILNSLYQICQKRTTLN